MSEDMCAELGAKLHPLIAAQVGRSRTYWNTLALCVSFVPYRCDAVRTARFKRDVLALDSAALRTGSLNWLVGRFDIIRFIA